ncbi:DUF4337 domain-containing protein [Cytophaga aurantiaca]|uniref:DUF4337 domain-containing protein n=1 Tax=Cytophaga aurantiaca TaxID=29530 RepID=UPI00037A3CD5|nr:DUF4337 domain-containing protein [Cytophaga aurantiaca]
METNEEGTAPEAKNLELFIGVVIAVFAAVLAINDLGAGRYGDDEMIAHNNQTKMYNWYQAKSIKGTLAENQLDLLNTLEKTNSIKEEHKNVVDSFKLAKAKQIKRYDLEKEEILNGSANIDKEKWALKDEKTGEKGTTIGAKEWDEEADKLGDAGDMYDLSSLFLQICIVFGAISLVIQQASTRKIFFYLMIGMGIVGTYFTIHAYTIAMG